MISQILWQLGYSRCYNFKMAASAMQIPLGIIPFSLVSLIVNDVTNWPQNLALIELLVQKLLRLEVLSLYLETLFWGLNLPLLEYGITVISLRSRDEEISEELFCVMR